MPALLFLYIAYNNDFEHSLPDSYNIFDNTDVYSIPITSLSDPNSVSSSLNARTAEFLEKVQASAIKKQILDEISQRIETEVELLVKAIKNCNSGGRVIDPEQVYLDKCKFDTDNKSVSKNKYYMVQQYEQVHTS